MSRAGFTLLELLAVVALIALLAALIVPLASGALDAAYQTECASNLRNLGAVYSVYAADHDYQLPTKDMLGNSSYRVRTDPLGLPHHFAPYVPTNSLWMCPVGRKTLQPNGVNYAWSRAQNLVATEGNIDAFNKMMTTVVVWDNMTYALPSVYNVPEGASGGPLAVSTALRFYPHVRRKKANYLHLDGRVETR
jgi:prepilin-type N-terminal cleavage/methylation domain-containing protein/prepilin-type processing-associated H-X9-DG protein